MNFALALLKCQVLQAINIAGLEPTVGFLHVSYKDRNALVFDVMEPFCATVDQLVFDLFEKTTFKKGDFYQDVNGEVRMDEQLKRYILASCRVSTIEIDQFVISNPVG